jgi:xylulokinase
MQADVYGRRVSMINVSEGPAFGAALLAASGTGRYKSVVEACAATVKVTSSTDPQAEAKRIYTKSYPLHAKLYRSLKNDFSDIAKIVSES